MKKHIILLLSIFATLPVWTQKVPVSKATQALLSPAPISIRQISTLHAGGLYGMAGALELQYARAMAAQASASAQHATFHTATPAMAAQTAAAVQHATLHAATPAMAARAKRSWLERLQRNYQAWKLKQQRRKRDHELQKQQDANVARQALLDTLPRINPQHQFETTDFSTLLSNEMPAHDLPLLAQDGILYRGMALDPAGSSLHNILTRGILLQDLGSHATTKLLAVSGGMRGNVSAVSSHPAINLTSFPQDALYWATQRLEPGKELLVIVSVQGIEQSGKVVLYSQDIPATQITQVLVPLHINGQTTWCQIEQTPNHTFRVTPYDLAPVSEVNP